MVIVIVSCPPLEAMSLLSNGINYADISRLESKQCSDGPVRFTVRTGVLSFVEEILVKIDNKTIQTCRKPLQKLYSKHLKPSNFPFNQFISDQFPFLLPKERIQRSLLTSISNKLLRRLFSFMHSSVCRRRSDTMVWKWTRRENIQKADSTRSADQTLLFLFTWHFRHDGNSAR